MQEQETVEVTTAETTDVAVLPVEQRAAIALGSSAYKVHLADLVEDAKSITKITNKDGYTEAQAKRMELRNTRLTIARRAKEAREDATAFSKAVIAEENNLIEIITPEETRIQGLQKTWDDALEAEKQRKIAEENRRKEEIRNTIDSMRNMPLRAVNMAPDDIRQLQQECSDIVLSEEKYGEHFAYAAQTRGDTLVSLNILLDRAIKDEEDKERARLQQEELDELRRRDELARNEREEAERKQREADQARIDRENEELRKTNERLARQVAELQAASAPVIPAPAPATIVEEPATAPTIEDYGRNHTLPPDVVADIFGTSAPVEPECPNHDIVDHAANAAESRPSDEEIIQAISERFDVSTAMAYEWIAEIQFFSSK